MREDNMMRWIKVSPLSLNTCRGKEYHPLPHIHGWTFASGRAPLTAQKHSHLAQFNSIFQCFFFPNLHLYFLYFASRSPRKTSIWPATQLQPRNQTGLSYQLSSDNTRLPMTGRRLLDKLRLVIDLAIKRIQRQ